MINRIIVTNRFCILNVIGKIQRAPADNFDLISIYTTPVEKVVQKFSEPILKQCGMHNSLSICTWDITPQVVQRMSEFPSQNFGEVKLFEKKDAIQIKEFLDGTKLDPVARTLWVHCDAGISRSGAVATFASEYLKVGFYDASIIPNPHILNTLRTVAGLKGNYESAFGEVIY